MLGKVQYYNVHVMSCTHVSNLEIEIPGYVKAVFTRGRSTTQDGRKGLCLHVAEL